MKRNLEWRVLRLKKAQVIAQLDTEKKNAVYATIDACKLKKNFEFSLNKIFKSQNSMRHVTIYTTDKEYSHFLELAKNLHYVKKIETDGEPAKEDILDNIKAGLEEMQLFKKGKLKTTSAKDFLNEL